MNIPERNAAIGASRDALTYELSGADASRFNIDDNSALSFNDAHDFEISTDDDGDRAFYVTATVTDGVQTDSQDIAVAARELCMARALS